MNGVRSGECAARAAQQLEGAFECVGPPGSDAQHRVRERLLALEGRFSDVAAAAVLRAVLGLDLGALRSAALSDECIGSVTISSEGGASGAKRRRSL